MSKNPIMEQLKEVKDPELLINIVDLGLIYKAEIRGKTAFVLMTLTFPGCPLGSVINREVNEKLKALPGIDDVRLEITFDPPWDFSKVSPQAKAELGII